VAALAATGLAFAGLPAVPAASAATLSRSAFDAVSAAHTSGFPTGLLPFAIQATVGGKAICLTRPAAPVTDKGQVLNFQACSLLDLSPQQEWYQRAVNSAGYGPVTDANGDCIVWSAYSLGLLPAGKCASLKAKNPWAPPLSWTQRANGTIANNGTTATSRIAWFVKTSTEPPRLGITGNVTATPFSILILDVVP
jgi:hypothetical protein